MNNSELFIDSYNLPTPFSKQENYKLLNKAKNGNKEAREKIIKHNIRLVLFEVATKFKKVNYDKRDLVSVGNIGLIKAIDTFDVTKNVEFVTYASICINNEILMFLRKLKNDKVTFSLNNFQSKEFELRYISYDDTDLLIEEFIIEETYLFIRNLINKLPEKDKTIIMMYFGFFDDDIYTQEEISKKINVSQSHISKTIKKVLIQIKVSLISNDFFEENTTLNPKKIKKRYNKHNNII